MHSDAHKDADVRGGVAWRIKNHKRDRDKGLNDISQTVGRGQSDRKSKTDIQHRSPLLPVLWHRHPPETASLPKAE